MEYIEHLTLNSGHLRRIRQGEVTGETLARVSPWLEALVEVHAGRAPLPVSALADYSALATVEGGALLMTVFGRSADPALAPPLISMGVARRSRHGAALWPLLTKLSGVKPAIRRPHEPWCAAVILPAAVSDVGAMQWLGDFERCIAWAWCLRSQDGR